jgi:hypothetical protein
LNRKPGKSRVILKNSLRLKGFISNGSLKPTVKAGEIVQWLKDEFGLGHGHAMAIYAWFKGKRD